MQNIKSNYKILYFFGLLLVSGLIIYDVVSTIYLNNKYCNVIDYDTERRRYCEVSGNEYIMSGRCNLARWNIATAVQIFDVYYDEKNPNVTVTLEIMEDKLGRREFKIGFNNGGDYDWGGYIYFDKNGNPVSRHGESIDKNSVEILQSLREEAERAVFLANTKWNLGFSINYDS